MRFDTEKHSWQTQVKVRAKQISCITEIRKMDEGIVELQWHCKSRSLMYSASPTICQLAPTFSKHTQDTQNKMLKAMHCAWFLPGIHSHNCTWMTEQFSLVCCTWEECLLKPILTATFLLSCWLPELSF